MGAPLQNSAQRQFQIGAQLVVGKATEVARAHVLIAGGTCVLAASQEQHMKQGNALEWEVKRLLVLQNTKDEAEWLDPDSKKLNNTG